MTSWKCLFVDKRDCAAPPSQAAGRPQVATYVRAGSEDPTAAASPPPALGPTVAFHTAPLPTPGMPPARRELQPPTISLVAPPLSSLLVPPSSVLAAVAVAPAFDAGRVARFRDWLGSTGADGLLSTLGVVRLQLGRPPPSSLGSQATGCSPPPPRVRASEGAAPQPPPRRAAPRCRHRLIDGPPPPPPQQPPPPPTLQNTTGAAALPVSSSPAAPRRGGAPLPPPQRHCQSHVHVATVCTSRTVLTR